MGKDIDWNREYQSAKLGIKPKTFQEELAYATVFGSWGTAMVCKTESDMLKSYSDILTRLKK